MRVLVTGAEGFIGKNLCLRLAERKDVVIHTFTRHDDTATLPALLADTDFVFHLAGVNRPEDPAEFAEGNTQLTQVLCAALQRMGRQVPVVFSSSSQAQDDNAYGRSKRAAEKALLTLQHTCRVPVAIFRLPNVFGKWCKPHYNSVVATFCHRVIHDLPLEIRDPSHALTLVYVDDVVSRFLELLDGAALPADGLAAVTPTYAITLGQLAEQIQAFKACRETLQIPSVGQGLVRALYATYVSHLPPALFAYPLPMHADVRGVFVEMLKTGDSGQFSYFTAAPGVTRGGHYHHTKTEKFLVIAGAARFRFKQMHTGETHELCVTGERAEVVETVPGWSHDITNVGSATLVVMLWANEVFDPARPDTISHPLEGGTPCAN